MKRTLIVLAALAALIAAPFAYKALKIAYLRHEYRMAAEQFQRNQDALYRHGAKALSNLENSGPDRAAMDVAGKGMQDSVKRMIELDGKLEDLGALPPDIDTTETEQLLGLKPVIPDKQ